MVIREKILILVNNLIYCEYEYLGWHKIRSMAFPVFYEQQAAAVFSESFFILPPLNLSLSIYLGTHILYKSY